MRTQKRKKRIRPKDPRNDTSLLCPKCRRTFVIGPDFVADVVPTGRVRPNRRRAEIQCKICGHIWWSKHPEALRKVRAAVRSR